MWSLNLIWSIGSNRNELYQNTDNVTSSWILQTGEQIVEYLHFQLLWSNIISHVKSCICSPVERKSKIHYF